MKIAIYKYLIAHEGMGVKSARSWIGKGKDTLKDIQEKINP